MSQESEAVLSAFRITVTSLKYTSFVSSTASIATIQARFIPGMKAKYIRVFSAASIVTAQDLYLKMISFNLNRAAFISWSVSVGIAEVSANEMYFCLIDWCSFHPSACAAVAGRR